MAARSERMRHEPCGIMDRGKVAMIRSGPRIAGLLALMAATALPGPSQSNPDLRIFFQQNIGLTEDKIAAIRSGQPVVVTLPPRTPAEVLLFGAVYIHASPETYFQFARNFDRLRKVPGFLALGVFTVPPQLSDLRGFEFDSDDIEDLKSCEPGNCRIQMPATSIEELHRSIDWSAADVDEQVNQHLQKKVLELLLAYQREGNRSWELITISVTRPRCLSSSLTCSAITMPGRGTSRISTITFLTIPMGSPRTTRRRSIGQR